MALQTTLTTPDYVATSDDIDVSPRFNLSGSGVWTFAGNIITTTTRTRSVWTAATKAACEAYQTAYTPGTGVKAGFSLNIQNLVCGAWQLELTETTVVVTFEDAP
jgi:hypothetical protein